MNANAIFSLRPPPAAKPSVQRNGRLESIAIRTEPDRPGYRLFRNRGYDYSGPTSGGPEWFPWGERPCCNRWHQRSFSGRAFPCRRFSPLEVLRQTMTLWRKPPPSLGKRYKGANARGKLKASVHGQSSSPNGPRTSRCATLGPCRGKQFFGPQQVLQCLLQVAQVVMVDGDLKLLGQASFHDR